MDFLVILVNDMIVQCQVDFKLTSHYKNHCFNPVSVRA